MRDDNERMILEAIELLKVGIVSPVLTQALLKQAQEVTRWKLSM